MPQREVLEALLSIALILAPIFVTVKVMLSKTVLPKVYLSLMTLSVLTQKTDRQSWVLGILMVCLCYRD